jgi:hypothetical protein
VHGVCEFRCTRDPERWQRRFEASAQIHGLTNAEFERLLCDDVASFVEMRLVSDEPRGWWHEERERKCGNGDQM